MVFASERSVCSVAQLIGVLHIHLLRAYTMASFVFDADVLGPCAGANLEIREKLKGNFKLREDLWNILAALVLLTECVHGDVRMQKISWHSGHDLNNSVLLYPKIIWVSSLKFDVSVKYLIVLEGARTLFYASLSSSAMCVHWLDMGEKEERMRERER